MMARSRASRSWLPYTDTTPGTAASIASRSASRSCQMMRCASAVGSSARRAASSFAMRAGRLSRFSRAASCTPIAALRNIFPCPSFSVPAVL
jgi:hypothetical protein